MAAFLKNTEESSCIKGGQTDVFIPSRMQWQDPSFHSCLLPNLGLLYGSLREYNLLIVPHVHPLHFGWFSFAISLLIHWLGRNLSGTLCNPLWFSALTPNPAHPQAIKEPNFLPPCTVRIAHWLVPFCLLLLNHHQSKRVCLLISWPPGGGLCPKVLPNYQNTTFAQIWAKAFFFSKHPLCSKGELLNHSNL